MLGLTMIALCTAIPGVLVFFQVGQFPNSVAFFDSKVPWVATFFSWHRVYFLTRSLNLGSSHRTLSSSTMPPICTSEPFSLASFLALPSHKRWILTLFSRQVLLLLAEFLKSIFFPLQQKLVRNMLVVMSGLIVLAVPPVMQYLVFEDPNYWHPLVTIALFQCISYIFHSAVAMFLLLAIVNPKLMASRFLGGPFFRPLSRMVFSGYLTHQMFIWYSAQQQRTPIHLNYYSTVRKCKYFHSKLNIWNFFPVHVWRQHDLSNHAHRHRSTFANRMSRHCIESIDFRWRRVEEKDWFPLSQ